MTAVPDAPQTLDAALVVHVWMEQDDPTLRGRVLAPQPVHPSGMRGVNVLCDVVCALLQQLETDLEADLAGSGRSPHRPPPAE
jgi:hypothetical protein